MYFPEYVNGKDKGGFTNIASGDGHDRVAGYDGIGMNGNINNKWNYFAPRSGFAYQINQQRPSSAWGMDAASTWACSGRTLDTP